MRNFHQSVLTRQVLEFLKIEKGEKYIDATIGGGGITAEILARGGRVLGIDWDEDAIRFVQDKFEKEIGKGLLILEKENFVKIGQLAKKHNFTNCAGIIFDLGISGYQLSKATRGFSFGKPAVLDMRMSKKLAVTAKDLLAVLSQNQLTELFSKFSQSKAAAVAAEIVKVRRKIPITTTTQLANIVTRVVKATKIHPATKVFLALRTAVNFELENLRQALPQALLTISEKGRLAVISFHSAEDVIVKDFFKKTPSLAVLTSKPVRPPIAEILKNPQSRSARLRVAEKKL